MMEKTFRKDISDKKEFTFDGDTLKQVKCYDDEKHIYIYGRYNKDGRLFGYEVVKGIKYKNPDGSIIHTYPSSEQFGRYGYFISKNKASGKRGISYWAEKLAGRGQIL